MKRMIRTGLFCVVYALLPYTSFSQLDPGSVIPRLQKHISILAADSLEGRETGSPGEKKSYDYISQHFREAGLSAAGTKGYLQPFPFTKRTYMDPASKCNIGRRALKAEKDFFAMPYSANAELSGKSLFMGYGISAPALGHDDYAKVAGVEGKIVVMEIGFPGNEGPHGKLAEASDLRSRVDTAARRGAAAVIFVNSDTSYSNPVMEYRMRISPGKIPVVFISEKSSVKMLREKSQLVSLKTGLLKEEGTGHNVVGYIDNAARQTVVIGAHYDHLGLGDEGSLHRGDPLVHNGADDNASGTAALIELARYLKAKGPKGNNYLFVAFSGEEKGLLGSSWFVRNSPYPLTEMNYMLNMDMVGRLKKEDPVLIINGAGTSDAWKVTFSYIKVDSLKIKTTDSGVGPSDHTSFYLKDIPALHFFSGTHPDYHKPSDDEPLINYGGQMMIMNFMCQLIERLDDKGKLNFVKTKDESNDNAPRFKVTLGVVPDYAFEGRGMRIDGVTEGKPAALAGLKAGDVVLRIGELEVADMMGYMKALGRFSKGEEADLVFLRNGEEMKTKVKF